MLSKLSYKEIKLLLLIKHHLRRLLLPVILLPLDIKLIDLPQRPPPVLLGPHLTDLLPVTQRIDIIHVFFSRALLVQFEQEFGDEAGFEGVAEAVDDVLGQVVLGDDGAF